MKHLILFLTLLSSIALGAGQQLSTRINIGLANGLTTSYQSSATFNAFAGYNYQVNTTSVAITATLPNGSINAQTQFVDDQGTWGTNNLTICPNGSQTIQGITAGSCLVANLSGAFVQLTWDNTNSAWTVTANGFNYDALYNPGSVSGIVASTGLKGFASNAAACTGCLGELLTGQNTSGQSLTTATNVNPTGCNVALTSGDWDVSAVVDLSGTASSVTPMYMEISPTQNTGFGNVYDGTDVRFSAPANLVTSHQTLMTPGIVPLEISSTTTYYINIQATFSVGTVNAKCTIYARRRH